MKLPSTENLLLDQHADGVLHVSFNRPEARNAMNRVMLEEFSGLFDALREDRSVRVVVLRGAGGHFCAGGDMKEMMRSGLQAPVLGEIDPIVAVSRAFGTMLHKVDAAPQVIVAVCEGTVLGGGLGLVCVSDIAIAMVDAKFGLPETSRGLPPAQIAPFVVERIGLTLARKLCLTGARFNGAEALKFGLVHECADDDAALQGILDTTVKQVLRCAPQANAMTKAIILNVARQDLDVVLDDAAQKFAQAVRGTEAPEGITAFMQKRAPKWAS